MSIYYVQYWWMYMYSNNSCKDKTKKTGTTPNPQMLYWNNY